MRKKIYLLVLFILACNICHSQNIRELENKTGTFEKYCWENFDITSLDIDEKYPENIHVRFKPYKYTSKNNVVSIGEAVGRAYQWQVFKGKRNIIVHIWAPYNQKIYARAYVYKNKR